MSSQNARISTLVAKFTSLASDVEAQVKESKYNEELPVSKLPFDILSNIFLVCQRAGSREHLYSFPLVVSHVCKQWRATALSTSLLWNTILLTRRACSLSQLEAHLTRSGTCFLDIHIILSACVIHDVMGLLIPHCRRWRRFYLDGDRNLSRLLPEYLHGLSVPLLEYIDLPSEVPADDSKDPANRCTIHLHDAPSLRFARLSGASFLDLQPHLTHLTTLELGSRRTFRIKRTDLVRSLRELRSLLHLSIRIGRLDPDDPPTVATPATLPHLCALCIGGTYRNYSSLLVLPRLESLFLEQLIGYDLPSLPLVKKITIWRCRDMGWHRLTKIATFCPSLTHLDLEWVDDVRCQYWLISLKDIPWASLQKITVRRLRDPHFSVLSSFVSAHIKWGHPLKEVFLSEISRLMLEESGWLSWYEAHVKLTFSDSFEDWSTITSSALCT